jgi:ABC-type cobalamin/Fe3+-siderophores transport system ATPase subunit
VICLLGPSAAGKSTFFKQVLLLNNNGEWPTEQLNLYKESIHLNLVNEMNDLLNIVSELQLSLNKKNKVNPTNSFNINKRE